MHTPTQSSTHKLYHIKPLRHTQTHAHTYARAHKHAQTHTASPAHNVGTHTSHTHTYPPSNSHTHTCRHPPTHPTHVPQGQGAVLAAIRVVWAALGLQSGPDQDWAQPPWSEIACVCVCVWGVCHRTVYLMHGHKMKRHGLRPLVCVAQSSISFTWSYQKNKRSGGESLSERRRSGVHGRSCMLCGGGDLW